MPEQYLYEYALIRVVPRVEREEFINVGVVLYCPKKKWLCAKIQIDADRLKSLYPQTDVELVGAHVTAISKICAASKPGEGGPIGQLDLASRFRWLTAMRSTIIQTSRVHPGFTVDPEETLKRLFNTMVL